MPFYNSLDTRKPTDQRTAEGLLRLKEALDSAIPGKTLDQSLLLATWNIREFGGNKSDGREAEPLFYIAEVLSRFDIVAIQEIQDNLDALDRLMGLLGRWWRYLVSDVTLGRQGNGERHAFIYDSRKLAFGGLAGELVPPTRKDGDELVSDFAFARTPYLAGFRAGWFKFTLCTQHFYYGQDRADDPQRVKEAQAVVKLLLQRMRAKDRWAPNAILLGDFNVFSSHDQTFHALGSGDFQIPARLLGQYTNAKLDKPFDQISLLAPEVTHQLELARAGVFPFYDQVYREQDHATYLPGESLARYREWRSYKMSDHLPVWTELKIDFGSDYLRRKLLAGLGG